MGKTKPLNPKQQSFVNEYLKDKNATRAMIAAGYSKKTAEAAGSRMLRLVNVKKAIDAGLDAHAKKSGISAERLIKRISLFAFGKKVNGVKVRHCDTLKACEQLGKHFKLFTDSVEVSGPDGGPQVIAYIPDNGRGNDKSN